MLQPKTTKRRHWSKMWGVSRIVSVSTAFGLLTCGAASAKPAGAKPGSATPSALSSEAPVSLPFAEAGLSEREAAAHLLDRFAYGARPGEIERVVQQGLMQWIEVQLTRSAPEHQLGRRLKQFDALTMTVAEHEDRFADTAQLVRMQLREQAR